MKNGFSIVELVVVILIVFAMTGISIFLYTSHQRLFKADEQLSKIADILREARQRALTQRETMRVEIDLDDNMVRLIDENSTLTHDDDQLIRQIVLYPSDEVKFSSPPSAIYPTPPELVNVSPATFPNSVYPPSAAHRVCTLRFLSNGTTVDAGTNSVGTNANIVNLVLYLWSPKKNDPSSPEILRAITVLGASSSIRLWEWDPSLSAPNKWKDYRGS